MRAPVVLFGACDRHNFGDLLLPHVAAALLAAEHVVYAGLAERDLRVHGGHAVAALSRLAAGWGEHAPILIHVGGEMLTCSAWQAAVMLLPPGEARDTIAYFEHRPREQRSWVRDMLGSDARAPYAATRRTIRGLAGVAYCGVGGVALDRVDAALRGEVLAGLRSADAVTVRDRQTLAHLAAAGIQAQLIPDPAVMVAELFADRIRAHGSVGEVAEVLRAFPRGYIAVQFSAEFSDDRSLQQIALQLDQVTAAHGLGVVLFRAGAAPWHDDLAGLGKVAARLRAGTVRMFASLDLWDICALLAHGRGYCGSSLHGRIVAMAYALPRVNFGHVVGTGTVSKQAAYAATWDEAGMPAEVDLCDIAAAVHLSLAAGHDQLRYTARRLPALCRRGFAEICAALK